MRWLLVMIFAVAGCSSGDAPSAADAGKKTCATTSCVKGASCVTPNGTTCRCLEDSVWTCGDAPMSPADAGFTYDSSSAFDVAPPPDGGLTREIATCTGTTTICGGDVATANAELQLRAFMETCGAYCTKVSVYSAPGSGCPLRVVGSVEWMDGALDCVAKRVSEYLWDCATEFHATTGSCPD